MKLAFVGVVLAGLLLGVAGSANAFEACFATDAFTNVWRFEFTQFGNFFNMNGRDRLFVENPAHGTTYIDPSGAARLGFTTYGNGAHLFINGQIVLGAGSGPFTSVREPDGATTSGTIFVTTCTPGTGAEPATGLRDAFAR